MPLTKPERITISKRIVDYSQRRASLAANLAAIQSSLANSEFLDLANRAMYKRVDDRIRAYHLELGSMYATSDIGRANIEAADITAAAEGDFDSRFYPINSPWPPSLSSAWTKLVPYMRTAGFGKFDDEEFTNTPTLPLESVITGDLESYINTALLGWDSIELTTGIDCAADVFTTDAAMHALMDDTKAQAQLWLDRLNLLLATIPTYESSVARKNLNTAERQNITAHRDYVVSWLALPDFNPAHGQTTCAAFHALDPDTLGPTKFSAGPLVGLKTNVDARQARFAPRATSLLSFFGLPEQDLSTGEVVETAFSSSSFATNVGSGYTDPNPPSFDVVGSLVTRADGRIVVGGTFTKFNGQANATVNMLSEDGEENQNFRNQTFPGSASSIIYDVCLLADGGVLLSGKIPSYKGAPQKNVVKLLPSGAEDTVFNANVPLLDFTGASPAFGAPGNGFAAVSCQLNNGQIVVAGAFGAPFVYGVIKLNPNGTEDTSFTNAPAFVFNPAFKMGVLAQVGGATQISDMKTDGANIYICGPFSEYHGRSGSFETVSGFCLTKVDGNNTMDLVFRSNMGTGFALNAPANRSVDKLCIQPDGKVIVGGKFILYNGATRNRLIRLNPSGTQDTAFYTNMGAAFNGAVTEIALQPDGKIIVAGGFTQFNGNPRNYMVRLNSDGTEDLGFTSPLDIGAFGVLGPVRGIGLLPNGKIIIGGRFTTIAGQPRAGIAKLNVDGTEDAGVPAATEPGVYFERWKYLQSLINKIGGSSVDVYNHRRVIAAQQQAIQDADFSILAYRQVCNAVLLSAPTNGTVAVHVKDTEGFFVGDRVFITSDTQDEIVAEIVSIQGNSINISIPVPAKYRPSEWGRFYKDLT